MTEITRINRFLLTKGGKQVPIAGYRYCETCRTYKPKDKRPAVKGWKCKDCRSAGGDA